MTGDSKELRAEIVRSGTFLYGGQVPHEVWIVKQNFEYWFEEEYDETERLNADGEVFKIIYARESQVIADGPEFFTVEEAIRAATAAVHQSISWDDHRLQKLYGGRGYSLNE